MFLLPYELQRIIYEYDDTYKIKYRICMLELCELFRTFPRNIMTFDGPTRVLYIIPKSSLFELSIFIKTTCAQKRSMHTYNP